MKTEESEGATHQLVNAGFTIAPALLLAPFGTATFVTLYSIVYSAVGPVPYGGQLAIASGVFGAIFGALVGGFSGREVFRL